MNASTHELLKGTIQRIIFSAKDTGFAIAVMQTGTRNATLSGNLPQIVVGEEIVAEGKWTEHPKYGKQFNTTSYMKVLPTKTETIETYLSSGMIKGLGPGTASKIVKYFGAKTLDVLSSCPDRLMEIPGIGEKKCETIANSWKEQMAVQDIMVFLSGCGITPIFAAKIYRKYGRNAMQIVQDNPYKLAYDIVGMGFIKADVIARKVGIADNSPQRIQAGTLYTLEEGVKEGHIYFPEPVLLDRAVELLNTQPELVETAIANLISESRVVVEEVEGQRLLYTPKLYVHEKETARLVKRLSRSKSIFNNRMGDVDEQIKNAESKFQITLSPEQRSAVEKACFNTVSVLTGGPGTGKTLTTKVIVEIFKQKEAKVLLAAPTGKAAKRLESCGGDSAATIHRLLEFAPWIDDFQRGQDNPLEGDVIIVDEFSMADISLFYYLLCAIPAGAHLVVIGDADQLPSVGPGLSMRHMVESRAFPLTVLNQIYRQAEGSDIVLLAHAVNQGVVPKERYFGGDCVLIEQDDPAKAAEEAVKIVTGLRAGNVDCQVLSPMHRGDAGTSKINQLLQDALNPIPQGQSDTYQVTSGFLKLRIGDSVIQTKNDYFKNVFNGDMGVVAAIDHEEKQLDVLFEGRGTVSYDFLDLDQLALASCLTVHKSQGSEFETVVYICLQAHYVMLARNLFYTAVSRAKKKIIIIGTTKAMAIAVHNDKQKARFTRLKDRLAQAE